MNSQRSTGRDHRWLWIGVAVFACAVLGDAARHAGSGAAGLLKPARAQDLGQTSAGQQAPALLSEREVRAGLAVRLERMRQRQAVRRARKIEEQRRAGQERGAATLRHVPPHDPPVPVQALEEE